MDVDDHEEEAGGEGVPEHALEVKAARILPAEDLAGAGKGGVGEGLVRRAVPLAGCERVEHGSERLGVDRAQGGVLEDEPVVVPVDGARAEGVREGAEDGEDDEEEI